MYLLSEAYKQLHNILFMGLLEGDDKFGIFSYIADSSDVFDRMAELEMSNF